MLLPIRVTRKLRIDNRVSWVIDRIKVFKVKLFFIDFLSIVVRNLFCNHRITAYFQNFHVQHAAKGKVKCQMMCTLKKYQVREWVWELKLIKLNIFSFFSRGRPDFRNASCNFYFHSLNDNLFCFYLFIFFNVLV